MTVCDCGREFGSARGLATHRRHCHTQVLLPGPMAFEVQAPIIQLEPPAPLNRHGRRKLASRTAAARPLSLRQRARDWITCEAHPC
jgi:hypothetical protein